MDDRKVIEKHLRRKVVDKNGNPVINQFGHAITPELTGNEIAYVEQELAKGRPVQTLANELETTRTRIMQVRDNKAAHDRMMEFQKSVHIPHQLDAIIDFLCKQSEQIDDLSKAVSRLVTEQGKIRKALYLKQIGEAKLRTDNRNLKIEREELRKLLHKKTGIDVGPYKRDG